MSSVAEVRTITVERDFQFSHFDENPFSESSELKVKGPQSLPLYAVVFINCIFLTFHP